MARKAKEELSREATQVLDAQRTLRTFLQEAEGVRGFETYGHPGVLRRLAKKLRVPYLALKLELDRHSDDPDVTEADILEAVRDNAWAGIQARDAETRRRGGE